MKIHSIVNLVNHNKNLYCDKQKNKNNFCGLTKCLKNQIYLDGQKDIELILSKKPNTNPVVGQLPNFIFKKLPENNRKEAILDILNVFDEVSNSIREHTPVCDPVIYNPSLINRPESVNKLLTDVFRKYGILGKYDKDIDVQYIDQGGKGKVFKLDGLRDPDTEDEFVIKVFHQIKGKDWHPFKSHGCYAEINNGIYWKNHEGHDTHRGKFFFASLKSGYMVSKYLDEDVPVPKRVVPEYKYGIKCTDEEKEGPINGYNRIKGYNYDYGGMRVVNRLKNSNKIARQTMTKIREMKPQKRVEFWEEKFHDKYSSENLLAGLALGIKYLDNRSPYVERCMKLNKPVVDQALGYVLKYLPHEEAVECFEELFQTTDEVTQIILFNEIPLLAKRKAGSTEMHDDINAQLKEIIPERINTLYLIAEKYAMPSTIEHLASFVHLLPENKIKQHYEKLTQINNPALQERLLWKFNYLPNDMREYAIKRLASIADEPTIVEKIIDVAERMEEKDCQEVKELLARNRI